MSWKLKSKKVMRQCYFSGTEKVLRITKLKGPYYKNKENHPQILNNQVLNLDYLTGDLKHILVSAICEVSKTFVILYINLECISNTNIKSNKDLLLLLVKQSRKLQIMIMQYGVDSVRVAIEASFANSHHY